MPKYASRAERFAAEYTVDLNASAAARRAGYARSSAGIRGYQLLGRPAVQEAIANRAQRLFASAGVVPERVLEETARIAFANLRPLLRDDGAPKNIDEMDGDTLAAVCSIDLEPGSCRVRRLLPFDRFRALILLGKYFDLFDGGAKSMPPEAWPLPSLPVTDRRRGVMHKPDSHVARFVDEYKIDLNAKAAVERAGYGSRGARLKAVRLMRRPDVQAAVAAHMDGLCGDLEGIAQRAIAEVARVAFTDLRDVFRSDGTVKAMGEIDDDTMAGLAVFGPVIKNRRRLFRVSCHDKLAALGLLLRYVKLFSRPVGMTPN